VGRAAVNVPVSQDIAIRASGFYRKDPGYIDDPKLGSDVNDGKTFGGRVSLLVKPTENFTIRGTAFLENLDSNGNNEVDLDPTTLKPVLGSLTQSRTVPQPNNIKYRIYNATADYDFGSVNLISSTSYGTLDEAQIEDLTALYGGLLTSVFGQPLGALLEQGMKQRRFTQEVRLSSSGKRMIDWTIGGFYTHENNKLSQLLDAVDPDSGAIVAALSPLEVVALNSKYSEIAGFANATVHFSSQFDLTFGGRYSHNKQTNQTVTSGPLAGAGDDITGGSNANVFTFSVAPAFHPTDHMTIYARVARGYQPGGPNALPPLAPDTVPRVFGSSTTMNYEAGIKSELIDRLLTLELTAFQIDWKDIQLLAQIDGYGVNANGGKARSKGVELTASLTPISGLTLSASGAYIDAKLAENTPDVVGGLDGDPLPYNPHWSGTLAADYSRALSGNVNGIFGVSWRHTGKRRSDFDPALGQLPLGEMDQVDAHAGATFGNYRIDAFVRNLTDSRGISNVGHPGEAPNGAVAAAVIRPRSIGLTFGVHY
jgi:outer membrane receptor protein involved in Fe transport